MPTVDPRLALALAARACCDVRTARDFIGGRIPRGYLLRARLADASRELGITPTSAPAPPPAAA